jgi:hypothetical protein
MCQEVEAEFSLLEDQLFILDRYSVDYLYPGETASKEDAKEAVGAIKIVRHFAQLKLGID